MGDPDELHAFQMNESFRVHFNYEISINPWEWW